MSATQLCTFMRERLMFWKIRIFSGQSSDTGSSMHFFTNSPSVKHFPEAAISLEIWKLTFVAFALSLSNTLKNYCSLPRLFMRLAASRLFPFRFHLAIVGCWVSKCRLKLYYLGTATVSRHTRQIILFLFVTNKYLFVHSELNALCSLSIFLFFPFIHD